MLCPRRHLCEFPTARGLLTSSVLLYFGLSTLAAPVQGSPGHIRDIVHHVSSGDTVNVERNLELQIFCRKADPKALANYFRTATLRITSTAEDIKLMHGHSEMDVYNQYMQTTKWLFWAQNLLPWRTRDTNFPTFNASCVGISTSKPYMATLITKPINGWSLAVLLAGIVLFFLAPELSRSTSFFYGSGTFIGALAAIIILAYATSRMLPKNNTVAYTAYVVLSSLCVYMYGEFWNRFQEYLQNYLSYILAYLTVGAGLSFILCYRLGPPENPKTLNIIRWILQGCGLVLIHYSSDLIEVSTTIIFLTIVYHNFSGTVFYELQRQWKRRFPPKPILLTEEEYITQGAEETNKELEKLREFCSSPNCNAWKLVPRLKDPRRFSEFVEGRSHLNDNEMMDFETEIMKDSGEEENEGELLTDDSDDNSINGPLALQKNVLANGNGHITDDDDEELD